MFRFVPTFEKNLPPNTLEDIFPEVLCPDLPHGWGGVVWRGVGWDSGWLRAGVSPGGGLYSPTSYLRDDYTVDEPPPKKIRVEPGQRVTVVAETDDAEWCQLAVGTGTAEVKGWLRRRHLRVEPPVECGPGGPSSAAPGDHLLPRTVAALPIGPKHRGEAFAGLLSFIMIFGPSSRHSRHFKKVDWRK